MVAFGMFLFLGSAQRAESFSHSSESTFLKTQLSACRAH